MLKKVISILFSIIFLSNIVAPAVLVLVDDNIDISISISMSESGEIECEKDLDIEYLLLKNDFIEYNFVFKPSIHSLEYCYKKYSNPHLSLISPPPKYSIL